MIRWLQAELRAFGSALAAMDRQTLVVLLASTALATAQHKWGARKFFRQELAESLGADPGGIFPHLWFFGTEAVAGFVIPVLILALIFRRKPDDMGLGLGDWKLAGTIGLLYIPLVTLGCWLLSALPAFVNRYPRFDLAAENWRYFLIYELAFLAYFMGWEYLWRGFVIFGTRHSLGHWAIVVQMIPFAMLHVNKPTPEAFLAILGGLLLGALCWRCRSFWIAVPLHSVQMLAMDFFCALRRQGDVEGIGPRALFDALGVMFAG